MGGERVPVKSPDVETGDGPPGPVEAGLRDTTLELRSFKEYFREIHGFGCVFLAKITRKRKTASPGRNRRSHENDHPEEGGADEATAVIAETTANLAHLARRHGLEMLDYLLRMTHLEAEERLRLRSRRKLS